MSAKIEREKWSESSKRSYAYHYGRTVYEDITYTCRKCSKTAIFTGEEQRESYEVKKNYIWQRRTLCSQCNAELYRLKVKNLVFQEHWSKEKTSLQHDSIFIAEWLAVLEQFPAFGSYIGGPMKERLRKLLASVPNPSIGLPVDMRKLHNYLLGFIRQTLCVVVVVSIGGCDAWHFRRMDIADQNEAKVLAAIQSYAQNEGIPCSGGDALPIECWEQPIRIWALKSSEGIVVCYSALGIPLESGKFEKRMDRLEDSLREQLGEHISVSKQQCPAPPPKRT